jgi:Carbohydrate binding domain
MTSKRLRPVVFACALAVFCFGLALSTTEGQNLVGNPGFENGISNISPWTSTGNCSADNYPGAAHSGSYYFAFNGGDKPPNGVLSQVINTTLGTAYTLTFWQGISVWNQTASQKINVTVTGTGTLASQSYTITATAGTTSQVAWTQRTITFVADSASTTIQFADDATNPTINTDLLLDDVSVTATAGLGSPSPSPTSTPTIPPVPVNTPTPTPPPISALARTALATVTYASGGAVVSRCQTTIFDLVGVQPNDVVQVTIKFIANSGVQAAVVEPLDGGTVFPPPLTVDPNAPPPPVSSLTQQLPPISLPVSVNGTVTFIFQASNEPGLNQVSVRVGSQELGLQFWVMDPASPDNNPPALTPTGNQIN